MVRRLKKLLDQVRDNIRIKHNTKPAHVYWIKKTSSVINATRMQ